jgi:beta-lactamase class C
LSDTCSATPVSGWRLFHCLLALLLLSASQAVAQPAGDRAGIDAAVRGFMERSGAPGVAVGVVTPPGRRFFWYGVASKETRRPVDERTLFEIGSISKTFAATLAAYAAETGALKLDDPVSAHVPELKGSHLDKVSLLNLATHTTGGMPLQLPAEVKGKADLTAWFRKWSPPAAPGTVRAYANPSAGLLGVATARALKGDFAALVREKVIAPLGLAHTFYDVPDAEQAHYAQGHARDGRPVRMSSGPLWREAWGVRTTAGDLLRYVEAQLGLRETDPALRRALAATHVGHVRAGPMTQALIWEWYPYPVSAEDFSAGHADAMVFRPNPVTRLDPPRAPPADAVMDKTGGTSGFGAYAAFIPGRRIGLVILANRNHETLLRVALAERIFAALGAPGVGGAP